MRKILLLGGLAVSLFSWSQEIRKPKVVTGQLIKTVPSLKNLRPDPLFNPRITRDLSGLLVKKTFKDEIRDYGTKATRDPVLQKEFVTGPKGSITGLLPGSNSVITQNYDGMNSSNVSPGDPALTAGPNHVIQMINGSQGAYFRIWNKSGGNAIAQTYMYQMFTSPGYSGAGDPIVMYDQFADRYVLTEFGFSGGINTYVNTLIWAISVTNDPTGGWYIYKFVDNSFFVDYPHYSAWPDAYYGTTNDFNPAGDTYLGSSVYAFEKSKMISGNSTATVQKIRLISADYATKFVSVSPVNISGSTAPAAGTPGLFLYFHDDNRTASTSDVDSVGILSIKPDFQTPANTLLTFEQSLPVAAFKSNVCPSRNCVPSGGASGYDDISDRFMNKIQYRNFGTHESIVATHTVDGNYPALPNKSSIRWYELRRTGGSWKVNQQSTYSPDADGRFMGSININSKEQIALSFNTSGAGKFASINFTGRNATDPAGLMVYDEGQLQKGDGYGTAYNRWGDYNELVVDPVNDSIFWNTGMYGSNNWKTRVSAFKLESLLLLDARLVTVNAPGEGYANCNATIVPNVTIRNTGTTPLTKLNINIQVNNGPVNTINWTGSLSITQSEKISLPAFVSPVGSNMLKIFTSDPNGGSDENKDNDTAMVNFSILTPLTGPITEGFENATFPPVQWRVFNENPGTITWSRSVAGKKSGSASAAIMLYDYADTGHADYLITPLLDVSSADSVILSFERAYKVYNATASFADTLEVVWSSDCGATFSSIWKRGGVDLATVPGTITGSYQPAAPDWQQLRLNIKPFIGTATSIVVGFKTINRFGQNIYLDDIQLRSVKLPFRDAFVKAVLEPSPRLCGRTTVPSVQISSLGKDTLKSVKVMFRLNNNPVDSVLFMGALAAGQVATLTLKSFTLPTRGKYTFTAFTREPNGLADENILNDTLRVNFIVLEPQPAPIKEGFEQSVFPPENWSVSGSNPTYNWDRTTKASSEKTASVWVRNFRFNGNGGSDDLYSPMVQVGAIDSTILSFDVAHVTGKFPGSTHTPLDTLEVLLTTDCGLTFTSVYKKWGVTLQTVGDPNFPYTYPANDTVGFYPSSSRQFRTERLDITKFVPLNSKFQVVFRNSSNKGNNTFLDNINISTVTLPVRLKQFGFMITPNPFNGLFSVQHLLSPRNLKAIQVTTSTGQLVFEKLYNGNASNNIRIDLSRHANGIYQVKLVYDNNVITERIIKRK